MQIHFLRHATWILRLKGASILVDPMLSAAAAMDPVQNAADQRRIPTVELPLNVSELKSVVRGITGVIVTHTHRDHWDMHAIDLLPKDIPILCQPEDESRIRGAGFTVVTAGEKELSWLDIPFCRTSGQHGTGETGHKLGPVSGFVLRAKGEPTIYVAGDTIWCGEVADALRIHTPDIVVVNAGAASFLTGGPITMTAEDVVKVCRACPTARVVATHMEAVNHCILTREDLRGHLAREGLAEQVVIPSDGAFLPF